MFHRSLIGALALALVIASSGVVRAQGGRDLPRHLLEDERNTIEVFRDATESVVFITNTAIRTNLFSRRAMEVPVGTGSGFVWDDEGHVVTNYHVVRGGERFRVTFSDGEVHDAEMVGADPNKDLAVLRVERGRRDLHPVRVGDSNDLVVGQKVLAIGNPFGLDHTLTTGVISALGREIQSVARTTITDVIQTDASINPGNSGGPLLDSRGQLIGVNTAIYSTSGASAGIGFAVPAATVRRIVPQLIEFGEVRRVGLGVALFEDDLARRWGIEGVAIRYVYEGTGAAEAGLVGAQVSRSGRVRLGDIVVGIDGQEVRRFDDLYRALDRKQPGDRVEVKLRREDRIVEKTVRVQLLN